MATKDEFLKNAFIYNSINAAVQHNGLYSTLDTQETRRAVRQAFSQCLAEYIEPFLSRSPTTPPIISLYTGKGWSPTEGEFLSAIEQLHDAMRSTLSAAESQGTFRVSHAQKSLALLLKYYWCDCKTRKDPPFCPIDREILHKAGITDSWTKLDDMDQYEAWLRKLKATAEDAGYPSLAAWELAVYVSGPRGT
jgi:hypothetical protein